MLKFLALKFKNQSINEVRPYEPQVFLQEETNLDGDTDEDNELKEIIGDKPPNFNNNNVDEGTLKINSPVPEEIASKENICAHKDAKEERKERGFWPIERPSSRESIAPEKRKWSHVNTQNLLQQFASGNDSSSSDDEIKDLFSRKGGPFSSSPPGKVTVLSKHSAFSARVRPTSSASGGNSRKKHRVVFAEDEALFSRPTLNFEKMQQKTVPFKRNTHGLSRPRPLRIRSLSNPRHNRSSEPPSLLMFKPIQMNTPFSLAPVEEPSFAY